MTRASHIGIVFLALVACWAANLLAGEPEGKRVWQLGALDPWFSRFEQRQAALNRALENVSAFADHADNSTVWLSSESPQQVFSKKSRGRAFLQSLVLPGWGQHYAESNTIMRAFITSEALLWAGYIGLTTWSNWLEDDYRTFSVTHAEVEIDGKPKDYFVDIGNFDSIFDFNQAQLRNRDVSTLYPETDEFFWRWDTQEHRREFKDLRVRSDRADDRSELVLAVILVNHLASAIHSTLAVFKFNKRLEENQLGIRIQFDNSASGRQIALKLSKGF